MTSCSFANALPPKIKKNCCPKKIAIGLKTFCPFLSNECVQDITEINAPTKFEGNRTEIATAIVPGHIYDNFFLTNSVFFHQGTPG